MLHELEHHPTTCLSDLTDNLMLKCKKLVCVYDCNGQDSDTQGKKYIEQNNVIIFVGRFLTVVTF